MSDACPSCGSPEVSREGSGTRGYHRLEGGRAVAYEGVTRRILCRGCGRKPVIRDAADVSNERRVRDHVVGRAFVLGQVGAGDEAGIGRGVVQRFLREWAEPREAQVEAAAPDFLLVEPLGFRGGERLLLVDVDRESLVEVIEGIDALPAWLLQEGRLPALRACLPVSPALHAAVRASLPGVRAMIAPSEATRALRAEADAALRALRRRPDMRRRNGMPTPPEFVRSLAPLSHGGPGWPLEASALRDAVRAVLALLRARSRADGERVMPETEMAASGAPRILRWLATWREPLLEGLGHAFVDVPARLAREARRAIARRRPVLAFEDLRCLVLLRDFVMREEMPGPGMPGRLVSEGRPLRDLPASLAAT